MTTTDHNGIVQITDSDGANLSALINGVSSSVSSALDTNVRTFKAADQAAADALLSSRGASVADPLIVRRTDLDRFQINTGTGWKNWPIESATPIPKIAAGSGSMGGTIISPGQYLDTNIVFPAGLFTAPPTVIIQGSSSSINTGVRNITTSGCVGVLWNAWTGPAYAVYYWIAVQS